MLRITRGGALYCAWVEEMAPKLAVAAVTLFERKFLAEELQKISAVKHIYPSDANFLLIKIDHAAEIYGQLVTKSIIVRNRSTVALCESCLRITVGKPEENKILLAAIQSVVKKK